MPSYAEQLASAVDAVAIRHVWSWSWFGDRETLIAPVLRPQLSPETMRGHLVHVVRRRLYSHFYCTGTAVPVEQEPTDPSPASTRAAFVEELTRANDGGGYLEPGWTLTGRRDGRLEIRSNGLVLTAAESDLATPSGEPLAAGAAVARRMPKELRHLSPGFLVVMGDEPLLRERGPVVRSYWNIRPEGAAQLVGVITSRLNCARIPFRLKIVDDPARFTRCDAAVLYTAANEYPQLAPLLAAAQAEVAPYLEQQVPAFTKPLAPGLGIAEEPAHAVSFGDHRCRILGEGLVRAFEQRQRGAARVGVVRRFLAESGVSLERPFLNGGSDDVYELAAARRRRTGDADDGSTAPERIELLETAAGIGASIVRSAVWHGDRCNWLASGLPRNDGGTARLVYRPLGPDVYAGTSGVSLFLAELAVATGDAAARRTSLGAVRQAAAAALESPSLGLYDGALGAAVAAAYVGRLLHEPSVIDAAGRIARCVPRADRRDEPADLLSGRAGGVVASLLLRELLDDEELATFAVALGDELVATAERQDGQASWSSAAFPKQRNLLGLSHGTAGIAFALLELHRSIGAARHRELAEAAFAYERSWFVPDAKAWPDFRGVSARARIRAESRPLPVFWCHGAAGIALSRVHATAVLGDAYRVEAVTALETTAEWTERMLAGGNAGFSLCHGLAGNADILASGSRSLGGNAPGGADVTTRVAALGIRRYARTSLPWPFDRLGTGSPSLMLGLAGVGHFYLRLHDPDVPSLLLLDRDALVGRSSRGR
jgi:class II lanthipeptide synthase